VPTTARTRARPWISSKAWTPAQQEGQQLIFFWYSAGKFWWRRKLSGKTQAHIAETIFAQGEF